MKILAIESSCDETAAAVVENGIKILSSVVSSSSDLHLKTGGVIPEIAAREQLRCIVPVVNTALQNAFDNSDNKTLNPTPSSLYASHIDAIAVTYGPGLIGSLLVGVETAKSLALAWKKPLVPVNHLVGHLYANWVNYSADSDLLIANSQWPMANSRQPPLPAIAMVISGGHTDLILMKGHGKITYLGGTRDDAAGECFDKTARLLGLAQFNGGPAVAKAAELYLLQNKPYTVNRKPFTIHLPRPMINSKDFDFSFSGLKTAVLREVNILKSKNIFNEENRSLVAYEVQEAITDVVVGKLLKAVDKYQPASLLLAGGVSANMRLRKKLELEIKNLKFKIPVFIPSPKLCTDNAAYIASCAYFNYHEIKPDLLTANPSLTIID